MKFIKFFTLKIIVFLSTIIFSFVTLWTQYGSFNNFMAKWIAIENAFKDGQLRLNRKSDMIIYLLSYWIKVIKTYVLTSMGVPFSPGSWQNRRQHRRGKAHIILPTMNCFSHPSSWWIKEVVVQIIFNIDHPLQDLDDHVTACPHCRDPSLWETRGTHLTVTRGTCYQPDHHHPDSPKDTHDDGSPIRTASREGKWRFNFSYPRKSKRRWQNTDIRTTFMMHPLHNASGQLACATRT